MPAGATSAALDYLDGDFLYSANKRERSDFERRVMRGRGTRAPHVPHGLNDYAHLHDVAFLSSLNPTPESWAFMRDVTAMTDAEIKYAHNGLAAVQAT